MTSEALSRLLALAAEGLAERGYPHAGLLRQAARQLLEDAVVIDRFERQLAQPPGVCAGCGRRITQAQTGRPRRYCSARCRRASWERTKAGRKR